MRSMKFSETQINQFKQISRQTKEEEKHQVLHELRNNNHQIQHFKHCIRQVPNFQTEHDTTMATDISSNKDEVTS